MEFPHLFVVFDQLPAFIVVAQFTGFEGKREADGARIILRIHGGNDQVIAAWFSATLHIGDKTRDGFRFEEHQYDGGKNKIIFAVKGQVVQILNRRLQIRDPFRRLNALDVIDAHRVFIPRRHVIAIGSEVEAVAAIPATQIERFTRLNNVRAEQHL